MCHYGAHNIAYSRSRKQIPLPTLTDYFLNPSLKRTICVWLLYESSLLSRIVSNAVAK
jgi:hypothetical protein